MRWLFTELTGSGTVARDAKCARKASALPAGLRSISPVPGCSSLSTDAACGYSRKSSKFCHALRELGALVHLRCVRRFFFGAPRAFRFSTKRFGMRACRCICLLRISSAMPFQVFVSFSARRARRRTSEVIFLFEMPCTAVRSRKLCTTLSNMELKHERWMLRLTCCPFQNLEASCAGHRPARIMKQSV